MNSFLSVGSVFQYIGYILLAIIILLLMVLIHELGHYTAGKILKFKIYFIKHILDLFKYLYYFKNILSLIN